MNVEGPWKMIGDSSGNLWDPATEFGSMRQLETANNVLSGKEDDTGMDCNSGMNIGDERYAVNVSDDDTNKQILTHGYIHGHIHKHKDHTHIHGHIHNHDHNKGAGEADNNVSNKLGEDECKEIDDLSFCGGILCEELDDCFYSNCGDTNIEDNRFLSETSAYESLPASTPLVNGKPESSDYADFNARENSTSSSNAVVDGHQDRCDASDHNNGLCDFQTFKKPIFEDLINNVHSNLDVMKETGAYKKRKLSNARNFKLHFPHRCHETYSDEVSSDLTPKDQHDIHQSCFHTTIPDNNPPSNSQSREILNDFDFYVQFNNFDDYLDSLEKNSYEKGFVNSNKKIEYLNNDEQADDSIYSDLPSYYCRWDNCMRKVTDASLMQHVWEQHIKSEYGDQINENGPGSFQCEWNDCGFANEELNSLIDHVNGHKGTEEKSSLDGKPTVMLTPNLTPKSDETSPKARILKEEKNKESNNSVQITAMKIMPKRKGFNARDDRDSKYVCHWQVGVDETGNPIHCDKRHDTDGDLQNHLIEDHVGSGKSSYNCCWVGCERHNGKMFTQRQKLLRHLYIHTNFKPCKCAVCGASFAVTAMLQQHMRVHSGEKPFRCSICDKRFATSSSLSIHHRVHTGERPLVCKWPGCNKRFSESSNLTKHMKIHYKKHQCEVCGDEFDKKSQFKKHLKDHTVVQNEDLA